MTYFQAELNEAQEAIQRVRELHRTSEQTRLYYVWDKNVSEAREHWVLVCVECQSIIDEQYTEHDAGRVAPYPCSTIKALDGEQ